MLEDRIQMLHQLERIWQIEEKNIVFASTMPRLWKRWHNNNRFLLCLSGKKHIAFADGKKRQDVFFNAGEVIFAPSCSQLLEIWDTAHEMISVVFYPDFTRFLYISHNGFAAAPDGPDLYFHVPHPLSVEENLALEALLHLQDKNPAAAQYLFAALLEMLRESLSQDPGIAEDERRWVRIKNARHTLCTANISREDVADMACVHPATLSRILLRHGFANFRDFINQERLDLAEELLQNSELSIVDIAQNCGFEYTNYFIRLFRHRNQTTPAIWREKKLHSLTLKKT